MMEGSRSKLLASFVLVIGILPYLAAGQLQFRRCRNEPCQNGGECRPIFRLFYTCTCTDDYAGGNCQYERACSVNPCLNGGSCTDNPPDYTNRLCTCPPNVYGDSCELVRECLDDDVRCAGYCFPSIARCDYRPDCPDLSDEEGCNEIEITPTGMNLTSPEFPRPGYINDFDYTWYLTSPEDHYISLDFWTFDLEYFSDMIFIGEGREDDYDGAIYRLTGNYEVLRILPKSSQVWIRMVTDGNSSPNLGFKVSARAVPIDEAENLDCDPETEFSCKDGLCLAATTVCDGFTQCSNEYDEYKCPSTTCEDGEYIPEYERCNQHWFCSNGEDEFFCEPAKLGDKFYIDTPLDIYQSYGRYADYSNETWTFKAEDGLHFTIYFSYFFTEKYYDVWYIVDGVSGDGFGLSGDYAIDPFVSPSNLAFVHFTSDADKNDGYVGMELEVVNITELFYCEKGSFVHSNQICDGQWQCLDGRDEVECEPLQRGDERRIETKYYPVGYPNNNYQVWTFTTEDDLKLLLEISVLLTEENYDVLAISSGSSCTTNNYANFSGVYYNKFALSEDNTMCIFFSSDYSVQNSGLSAKVSAVAEEDYLICSYDGSVVSTYQRCDFKWDCPDGEDEQGCDLLTLYSAIPIQSPNFPEPYPPNLNVISTGTSEPGTEVYFEFDVFDFEEDKDFLIVGCGLDPFNLSTVVANLTGNKVTSLPVPCESIWLNLLTDGNGSNRGYSGTGYIVPVGDGVICSEDGSTVSKDNVCDGRWHCPLSADDEMSCPPFPLDATAFFESENYPSPYPADAYFIYSGSATEGLSAFVEFFDFDLQYRQDFLVFGCGRNPFDRFSIVRNFTGSDVIAPFTINCDSIWWSLHSDSDEGSNRGYFGQITVVERGGFTCLDGTVIDEEYICDGRWHCLSTGDDELDCPSIPVGISTPFQSDNYPNPYPVDQYIIYYGAGVEGASAVVEFIDFDLQEGQDFLTFGCGDDPFDPSSVVESFTGGLPPPLTMDCNRIWFSFSTDSSEGNNRGYFGTITTIERQVSSGDLVTGRCISYLPYMETAPEALFPFLLPLDRDVIRDLIMGPACNDDEILRGICAALYPPREDTTRPPNTGLCSSTCQKFSACASIDLLMNVDCNVVERDEPNDDYPGLCLDAEDK